jgi:anti-anti-sigma regulatory factor
MMLSISGGLVKTVLGAEAAPLTIQLQQETSAFGPRALRTSIMTALGNGDRRVVVDCFGWEKLDLVVLSALVQGAKACAAFGASFELVNLDGHVRDDIIALRLERRLGLIA